MTNASKPKRNLFIALGGGALATALIVVGAAVLPKGERGGGTTDTPPKGEATSQPIQPSPSETPLPTSTPELPPVSIEFKAPVLEQKLTTAEMDKITDLKTFAVLPFADRFAYAVAKNPNLTFGTPDNDLGFTTPNFIPGYFWFSIDGNAMNNGNTLEGAKVISANEYYGTDLSTGDTSMAYKASSESVLRNGGAGVSIGTTDVFVASGAWQSGTDRAGNPIDFINITSYSADANSGNRQGEDITYQTLRQKIKLLDGKTIIAYPRAYGISGKQSPIIDGTY